MSYNTFTSGDLTGSASVFLTIFRSKHFKVVREKVTTRDSASAILSTAVDAERVS